MQRKSIGRERDCDLVIADESVAAVHAWAELTSDGAIYVSSAQPENRFTLLRNDRKIPVQRTCLCVGDQLGFGGQVLALQRFSGLFGAAVGARLTPRPVGPKPLPKAQRNVPEVPQANLPPRRNPDTGKIED